MDQLHKCPMRGVIEVSGRWFWNASATMQQQKQTPKSRPLKWNYFLEAVQCEIVDCFFTVCGKVKTVCALWLLLKGGQLCKLPCLCTVGCRSASDLVLSIPASSADCSITSEVCSHLSISCLHPLVHLFLILSLSLFVPAELQHWAAGSVRATAASLHVPNAWQVRLDQEIVQYFLKHCSMLAPASEINW